MIKICVALPNYVQGKLGGTQTFVDSLLPRLASDPRLELSVLIPKGQKHGALDIKQVLEFFPQVRKGIGPLTGIMSTGKRKFRAYLEDFDIVYFPLQSALQVGRLPIPSLVTIHDVQHLDLPDLFTRIEKWYRRIFYDMQSDKFMHIVTDSFFSKTRIIEQLRISSSKISVQYIGTDNIGQSRDFPRKKFFIYPARGWKHKNHQRLFEAMRIAIEKGTNLDLILTGEPPEIPLDLRSRVKDLGRVTQHELTHLYQTATGMIFPSLYEGFGLPPIEAMSAGCPTYVSNAGSLPEVCGNGSYYFDPMDIDAISDAILAMEFPDSDLIEKGIAIAREFNWDRTAQGYVQLFTELAESKF
jgi:glycosyltransferase involved in cell wall biosynthesis